MNCSLSDCRKRVDRSILIKESLAVAFSSKTLDRLIASCLATCSIYRCSLGVIGYPSEQVVYSILAKKVGED